MLKILTIYTFISFLACSVSTHANSSQVKIVHFPNGDLTWEESCIYRKGRVHFLRSCTTTVVLRV